MNFLLQISQVIYNETNVLEADCAGTLKQPNVQMPDVPVLEFSAGRCEAAVANKQGSVFAFLDLSCAFNTVNHESITLLKYLMARYGTAENSVLWRKIAVSILQARERSAAIRSLFAKAILLYCQVG